MKIGIYINKSKDIGGVWSKKLHNLLALENLEYVDMETLLENAEIDCIVALGGDGTILGLTEYSSKNDIPIIGINAGKLGFLTEFETFEMANAVKLIKEQNLKEDKRIILEIEIDKEKFYALNDCVIQRIYVEQEGSLIVDLGVSIDNTLVDKVVGDGVIISTPTGSTAYSMSSGGAILAPGINSFEITSISARTLHHRPIVYSAESECVVTAIEGCSGVFADGKLIKKLSKNDKVILRKSKKSITFLRKTDSNFYNRLLLKLNNERGQND